jgi:serine/threonine-protein kinase
VELVGRYRIERRIGDGAMADVYRARDPSIDRDLAIKVLKPDFRQEPEIVGRFLREAKAAGALSHPNIVTIYDVGEVDGFPYIAMELLDGEPLDALIRRRGKLPLDMATRLGGQLARALDYAHGLGVIHRDIKPSNIMICDEGGTAKILDFGIARLGGDDRLRAELNMLRTQVGQVLGTPRYMSPEQALGLEIDHRTDLFSLGAVLYEMITGRAAFGGSSLATIALQITRERPEPVAGTARDCPRGLQFVIDKLLAKQPDRRYASGADVAAALAREQEALGADRSARRRLVSLPFKLTILMASVTAAALFVSIGAVLDRQYAAMERMAMTSGTSIASFVANNVSLRAVENAGLPPEAQDWLPVQAFVTAASDDENVQQITMVDAQNIIRGSSDPALVGHRYVAPKGEALVERDGRQLVSATDLDGQRGFRFVRTILYAGKPFGKIDLTVGRADLDAAAASSRNMLIAFGVAIFLVVLGVSFAIARLIERPLRRLREALRDVASGKADFRISHRRRDEFGELFDQFNDLAASLERHGAAETESSGLDATRIDARPSIDAPAPDAWRKRLRA